MSLQTWLVSPGWDRVDDGHETIEQHLADILEHWNEADADAQTFLVVEEPYNVVAVLTRHPRDPQIATAFFPDGRSVCWRVRYLLDADGHYASTQIELLKERSPW